MFRLLRIATVALGAAALGLASTAASAASITTGVANWKFVGFSTFPTSANSGAVYTNTVAAAAAQGTAPAITRNGAWVTEASVGSDSPRWISALTNGATNGIHGLYTFELTLTSPPLAAGTHQITGTFTSDNLVESFTVNGVEILNAYVGPTEQSYKFTYTLPTTNAGTPITLRARVYNEAVYAGGLTPTGPFGAYPQGVTAQNSSSNPVGFILSGKATIVPLPPAVFGGMALLGVMGIGRIRRARGANA